jgi:hypothetical protein
MPPIPLAAAAPENHVLTLRMQPRSDSSRRNNRIMADFKTVRGSCFCGANQFEITQPAVESHHCHCSICTRLHGAAFVTFSIFPGAGAAFPQLQAGWANAPIAGRSRRSKAPVSDP